MIFSVRVCVCIVAFLASWLRVRRPAARRFNSIWCHLILTRFDLQSTAAALAEAHISINDGGRKNWKPTTQTSGNMTPWGRRVNRNKHCDAVILSEDRASDYKNLFYPSWQWLLSLLTPLKCNLSLCVQSVWVWCDEAGWRRWWKKTKKIKPQNPLTLTLWPFPFFPTSYMPPL